MKRRSRPQVVQSSLTCSRASASSLTQPQVRPVLWTNADNNPRKLYGMDVDGPAEERDDRAIESAVSGGTYSDQLMTALKRKTQELCDETRAQYEQRLERQDVQHERQLQNLQRQLRDVVGSCVSLAEHEQIMTATTTDQRHHLDEIRNHHESEMRKLQQRCSQTWQAKIAVLTKQNAQEKAALMHRIEQLELLKSERDTEAKKTELSELRWSEKLEEAGRTKEDMQKQLQHAKKKLEDACHLIVSLKTRLQQQAKLARDLEVQRDKASETRDEVMKCKLAYAEMKGDKDTRIAGLEKELAHMQRALKDEKASTTALQEEVAVLRKRLRRQQCAAVELSAKEAMRIEHHAAQRKQLQKEASMLQQDLHQEKQATKDAAARVDELQHRAANMQLQQQTAVQDLRTRLEVQSTAEASLKRQCQRLQQRVAQYKLIVEKLHTENKQISKEVRSRDASTEAWAKKLFGRS